MSNKRLSFADRTPLFIGIVIIPLAASCAFGLGMGWHLGKYQENPFSGQRNRTELFVLASDCERREEQQIILSQAKDLRSDLGICLVRLENSPTPFAAFVASVPPLARKQAPRGPTLNRSFSTLYKVSGAGCRAPPVS